MPRKEKSPEEKLREALKTSEGWEDFEDMLKGVSAKCELQPLAQDKEPEILLNSGTVLDDLFGGGLSAGQTVELYGEYASGKTQIIFTMVVEAASEGLVIVVDAEDTFSRKRILQIAEARGKDVETINRNIILYKPERWEEQISIPANLPDPLPAKLRLVVIDSLMALFRSTPEFAGRSNLGKRQELIRWHLRQFKKIAKEQGAIIVYTNQVYDEPVATYPNAKLMSQRPVGGHSVAHIGDYRIFLRKAQRNVRIARLVDNSEIAPAERIFQINEKGIDDVSQEQRLEAEKRENKFEKEQTSGVLVKKKKKTKENKIMEELREEVEKTKEEKKDE